VCRKVDLRQAGLRDLLPHERQGRDEVLDQARRFEVHGSQGRVGLRRSDVELL
jgi:hypothetical protein